MSAYKIVHAFDQERVEGYRLREENERLKTRVKQAEERNRKLRKRLTLTEQTLAKVVREMLLFREEHEGMIR